MQALRIAHVADEITQAGMIESRRAHIVLFQFVAAEDDELLRMVFTQHHFDKLLAERSRPPGHQHNLFLPVHPLTPLRVSRIIAEFRI